jgi:hypothetical protein
VESTTKVSLSTVATKEATIAVVLSMETRQQSKANNPLSTRTRRRSSGLPTAANRMPPNNKGTERKDPPSPQQEATENQTTTGYWILFLT